MSKEGSVAPKERVNISYKPATGGAQEERELPLKTLVMGDFTNRPDPTAVGQRKAINVNKDNFNEVLKNQNLSITANVADKVSGEAGAELPVSLNFSSLDDFGPEGVAKQVPALRQLLELRAALAALKGPLGNVPEFRKELQKLLGDAEQRQRLMKELGIEPKE
jgi:type VI secretion system protein ImpB